MGDERAGGLGADGARLVSIAQAAERLACSRAHVYRLIAEGSLGAVDISTRSTAQTKKRVLEADVERFITARSIALEDEA